VAERVHRWIEGSFEPSCEACGVLWTEYVAAVAPCTGNAYVCRVGRKLWSEPVRRIGKRPLTTEDVHPWILRRSEFAEFLIAIIQSRWPAWPGSANPKIAGLVLRLHDDPTVCPILADAMEEAGCTDAALLAALRTT
jgi:hypothetical protein